MHKAENIFGYKNDPVTIFNCTMSELIKKIKENKNFIWNNKIYKVGIGNKYAASTSIKDIEYGLKTGIPKICFAPNYKYFYVVDQDVYDKLSKTDNKWTGEYSSESKTNNEFADTYRSLGLIKYTTILM